MAASSHAALTIRVVWSALLIVATIVIGGALSAPGYNPSPRYRCALLKQISATICPISA